MQTVQRLIRLPALTPLRKIGLAASNYWPWPVAVRTKTGRRMFVDLRSGVSRGIFAKGEFDPKVFDPLQSALTPGSTFLDVGANVGYYSMLALDSVGVNGVIHAFEIDDRPLRCFRKTLRRESLVNVHLHEAAVGNREGTVGLLMHQDSGNSGVVETEGHRQVKMTTLDAWWRAAGAIQVHAIKLDIEGAELLALQGALTMLQKTRPLIVLEADELLQARFGYGPNDLLGQLAILNYRVEPLPGTWSPTLVAIPL